MNKRLKMLEEQKVTIEINMKNVKPVNNSGLPKGAGSINDISDEFVLLEDIQEKILLLREDIKKRFIEIENAILGLENSNEAAVIHKRYIEMKKWEVIADEISYSESQTHKIHLKALKNIKMRVNKSI